MLRWFWTAQLAFHLPGQPRVLTIDPDRPSYYNFRDRWSDERGCEIWIVGDQRHMRQPDVRSLACFGFERITSFEEILVPDHRDVPVFSALGYLKN